MDLSKFILFLSNIEGIGDASIRKLIISNCFRNVVFDNTEEILNWIKQNSVYFSKKNNINNLTIDDLVDAKKRRIDIERNLVKNNVKYITWYDEEYPDCFKKMSDFPVVIFYKGNIDLLKEKKKCTIIGTRKVSNKGIEKCEHLSSFLIQKNYTIISGLAEGCDTIAHRACLDNNGKTIAILGCGIDSIYPSKNKTLATEIVEKEGLLISEYALGFKAKPFSLVQRDRLQAAISEFVVVIQTDIDGGSMHASKAALNKYGKRLYVVSPNDLEDDTANGNKKLIEKFFAREIDDSFYKEV